MTEKPNELVALIDMDGTLCDYDGAMRRDMAKIAAPGDAPVWYDHAPAYMIERKKLIQDQPGWWRNLSALPLGFELMRVLRELEFRLVVLTKGPARRNSGAWSEKVEWCREYLGDVPVVISADKGLVYGRVLVDDWPDYVTRWLEWRPRGLVLMPAQPWNEGYAHPNVLRCTLDNLGEARGRAQQAAST
jgi:5'-nucleotidase